MELNGPKPGLKRSLVYIPRDYGGDVERSMGKGMSACMTWPPSLGSHAGFDTGNQALR
jgi:hypothetical protein